MLRTQGLAHRYGRLTALEGLDLELRAGECLALIGANGSGKSTAVRSIAGLLAPTAGEVRVAGADPHAEPDAERARAALALVPDTPLLYDDLTVAEHLELVGVAHGVGDDELTERIPALLERLGLGDRADFLPRELSRGMRQKAQLACALIRPAQLLVLDEPVVGLDPPSQRLLGELLQEATAAGVAVLLTTHQLAFADGLADRAVMLQDGAVRDQGRWVDVRGGPARWAGRDDDRRRAPGRRAPLVARHGPRAAAGAAGRAGLHRGARRARSSARSSTAPPTARSRRSSPCAGPPCGARGSCSSASWSSPAGAPTRAPSSSRSATWATPSGRRSRGAGWPSGRSRGASRAGRWPAPCSPPWCSSG